jgi:hypothetical protein
MSSFNIKRRNLVDVNQASISTVNGEPLSSFGELSVSQLTPTAQADFIYSINDRMFASGTFAGASVFLSGNLGVAQSGVNITGSAVLRLRRNLKYRPGMGSLMRATAMFDTPVDLNAQLIGIGNIESGYYFGYIGTSFGIVHQQSGQAETRKFTITTGGGTGNVTVTLDGNTVTVPITGGNDPATTAYQLTLYDYTNVGAGWRADAISSSVYFISGRSNPYTGSYNITGNSVVGTFSTVLSGSAANSTIIPQSSWNIDVCDGTGISDFNINPQKGNVYQIGFQYLGFGNAFFAVENPLTGRMIPVHMIQNANARTTTVLKNPQASVRLVSANFGSTTNVKPKTASMSAFTEGMIKKLDPRFAISNSFSGYNSTTDTPILALKANRVYNDVSCFAEFDILRIAASNESTAKTLTVSLYKDVKIGGAVNFKYADSNNSAVSYALLTAGTNTVDITGKIPFLTFNIGANNAQTINIGEEELVFNVGEIIVITIHTSGPVSGEVGVNWFEQQ